MTETKLRTAIEIIDRNPRYGFPSREAFEDYVKAEIEKAGHTPIRPWYSETGDCQICGEAGRCPGWHTEYEAAAIALGFKNVDEMEKHEAWLRN